MCTLVIDTLNFINNREMIKSGCCIIFNNYAMHSVIIWSVLPKRYDLLLHRGEVTVLAYWSRIWCNTQPELSRWALRLWSCSPLTHAEVAPDIVCSISGDDLIQSFPPASYGSYSLSMLVDGSACPADLIEYSSEWVGGLHTETCTCTCTCMHHVPAVLCILGHIGSWIQLHMWA